MLNKDQLRKKYYKIRKKNYFEIKKKHFDPLLLLLKKFSKQKIIKLSCYYASNFEFSTLSLMSVLKSNKKILTLLPVVNKECTMNFYKWNYLDPLKINQYGIPEPYKNKKTYIPNIFLVPLLAFDISKNRLGYGKGYYDKFLNKYLKINRDILTIGVAFSFQKYNKLPISKNDVRLNYILTEKGFE